MDTINNNRLRKAIQETVENKEKSRSKGLGLTKNSESEDFYMLLHSEYKSIADVKNYTKVSSDNRVHGVYLREEASSTESELDKNGTVKIGKGFYANGELTRENNDHAIYTYKDLDFFLPCKCSDSSYVMESLVHEYYKESGRHVKNEIFNGFKRETVVEELYNLYSYLTGDYNIQKENFDSLAYDYQKEGSESISSFLSDVENKEFFLMYKPRAGKNATTLLGFGKHDSNSKNNLCLVTGLWPSAFKGLWDDIDENHYKGKTFEYINTKDTDWVDQLKTLQDRGTIDWIFLCASMQSIDESLDKSVKEVLEDQGEDLDEESNDKSKNKKLQDLLDLNISHCIVDESDHGIRTSNSKNVFNKFNFSKTIYLSGTDLYAIKHEISEKKHALRTIVDEINDTRSNSSFKKPLPIFYTVDYDKIIHDELRTDELKHEGLSRTLTTLQKTNVEGRKDSIFIKEGLYYKGDTKIQFSREDEFYKLFNLVYTSEVADEHYFKPASSVNHLFATFQSVNALYAFHNMFVSRGIDSNTKILIANEYPDAETREKRVNKDIKSHGGNTIFCSMRMMLRGAKAPWEGVIRFDDFSSFSIGHQLQLRGQNGKGEYFYVYDTNVFRSHINMYDIAKNSILDNEDPKTMIRELMGYIPYLTNGDYKIKKHSLDDIMDSINELFSVKSSNFSEDLYNKNFINRERENLTNLFSSVEGEGSNNTKEDSDNEDHKGQSFKKTNESDKDSKGDNSKSISTSTSIEEKVKNIYFQLPWLLISQKDKKFQSFRELIQSIDNGVFTVWINRVGIFDTDIDQVKEVILSIFDESKIGHRVLYTMDKINSGEYNLSSLTFLDKENRVIPHEVNNDMLDTVKIEESNTILVFDTLGQTTESILEKFASINKKDYIIVVFEPNTLSYLYVKESLNNTGGVSVINNLEEIKDMKFDVTVGNPPYQEGKEASSYKPLYHLFMESAYKMSDKAVFITPARFLFNAGDTPEVWNKKMLNDDHLKVVWYESESSKVFPNVDIKGGIAITLRDSNQSFGKIGNFIPYNELNTINSKVSTSKGFETLTNLGHRQNKFSLENLYEDHPEFEDIIGSNGRERRLISPIFSKLPIFHDESIEEDGVRIYGLFGKKRVYKWMKKKYLSSHVNLNKYKVIVSAANGTGKLGEVLASPTILHPNTGFTSTFLSFGSYDNEEQAKSLLKYLKTKFSRTLLGILKVTQHNSVDVWAKIPLQDFTSNSDIDWNQKISDIDNQLYKKYKLNEKEIGFIESMVKKMD